MRLNALPGLALAGILTGTVAAQPPQPAGQGPTLPAGTLYRNDSISKALNMQPQQLERLNKVSDAVQTKFAAEVNALGTGLTAGERAARVAQLQQRYNDEWNKAARDVFNEQQFNRYQQLQWQHGGFDALTYPELQRRLNLTEAQQRALTESVDWSRSQMAELSRLTPAERQQALRAYQAYRQEYQQRFNRFLTPEQQRTWREITGEPFDFPPPFPQQPRP